MIIQPKVRGFICTTAHPQGCRQHVKQWIDYVKSKPKLENPPKKVLVIGASTGFGLASRIAAAFGGGAQTIGVFFEKPADGKRTATAGWYNTAAFEEFAKAENLYAKSFNGDAFSDEIKKQVLETIEKDWGGEVDLVIYSIASPRRTDPKTGETYSSVLKPISKSFHNKTIDVMNGKISEISIEPASEAEIIDTVRVMGGEDWQWWIEDLIEANLLAHNAKTVAFTYIGPEVTHAIYRQGTIGKAKEHLEQTAEVLNHMLAEALDGEAYISVNKALVTQASAAIPVVPLYISILYKVMKEKKLHEGCIEQMYRLLHDRLYGDPEMLLDKKGRIRLDDLEMRPDVQEAVKVVWDKIDTDNLDKYADLAGYREDFYRLFGFELPAVNYEADLDPDVKIGSL